ncbi:MAG TPA: acyltransferase [Acetobacteraceae bacterium]|nr:acyltransferase [Acetobacteraceae bacterium]
MSPMVTPELSTRRTAPAGAAGRNGGIDALRAVVTLLVVFHHTAITYGAIGGWYYKEVLPSATLGSRLLVLFCTVNQAWFMGLFFLLAGYYTPPAWHRYGTAGFIRGRLARLGIPIVIYALLLSPLTIALAATARGRPFMRMFAYRWSHGAFEPGPLWFTEALLIFSAAWLLLQPVNPIGSARPRPFPSNATLLIAALLTGAVAFLLRLIWPVGVNVAFLQPGYFASYVVLFAAGCLAADMRLLENIPARQAVRWRRIAWMALPLFPLVSIMGSRIGWLGGRAEGGWNLQALAYAFWEPFVAWGFILGLLAWFQRRFAVLRGLWPLLARRAYLIYIIHPPFLVATALAWRHVAAPALLKFVLTGSIACVLCFLAAGLLLRLPAVARIG